MRQPTAISPAPAPAVGDRAARHDHDDRPTRPTRSSWTWTLIEALANAGAVMNPTGAMVALRLREALEEEARRDRG
jgi:hypothetical protein